MNKRGIEEAGPAISVETIMFVVLSIAVLIFLFYIFTHLIK